MQQNPLVLQVNMRGFYRVCFCSVAVDVMPVLFLQVPCSMCWSSLTSACGALWTMKPYKSSVCWSRWDSTLNSLWSVRKTRTSSCHVWEHFHTAFTLMANWSWLGRGTWPCWSLEQSTCVSKQMHKLHSYELSVTTCRLSELVGGVYNFTIPRAFQSFG